MEECGSDNHARDGVRLDAESDWQVTEITLAIDKLLPAGWHSERSGRPYHGFLLILNGVMICRIGEERLAVEPEEVLYLPEGSDYTLESGTQEKLEYIIVNFRAEECGGSPLASYLPGRIVPRDKLAITEQFRRMDELFFYMPPGYRLEMKSILYGILNRLLHDCAVSRIRSEERRLYPAVVYMREHFGENCTTRTLASLCGVSVSHFRRLFRDFHGVSAGEYLSSLRMECAKKQLRTTSLPVSVIAENAGFRDTAYFCKAFRLHTGMTPLAFRRSEGEEQMPL